MGFKETKIEKWKVGEDTKTLPICTKILRIVNDGFNEPFELNVCFVLPSTKKNEHIALISTAPELIEILLEVKKWSDAGNHMPDDLIFKINNAIEKALKQ